MGTSSRSFAPTPATSPGTSVARWRPRVLNGGMEKKHGHTVYTLQGINISHLGKRKIIFKMPFSGDMLVSWRVYIILSRAYNFFLTFLNLHCYMPIWGGGAETDLDLLKVQVQDLEFLETWIPRDVWNTARVHDDTTDTTSCSWCSSLSLSASCLLRSCV